MLVLGASRFGAFTNRDRAYCGLRSAGRADVNSRAPAAAASHPGKAAQPDGIAHQLPAPPETLQWQGRQGREPGRGPWQERGVGAVSQDGAMKNNRRKAWPQRLGRSQTSQCSQGRLCEVLFKFQDGEPSRVELANLHFWAPLFLNNHVHACLRASRCETQ